MIGHAECEMECYPIATQSGALWLYAHPMRQTLRIPPAPGSTSFAAPLDVFDALRPHVEEYDWVVVGDLWLNGKPETERDLVAFEEEVNTAPGSKRLSWTELHELLSELIQVIDGTFVAFSGKLPKLPQSRDLREIHAGEGALVVTAVDSSFWLVTGESNLISHTERALPHAERISGYA